MNSIAIFAYSVVFAPLAGSILAGIFLLKQKAIFAQIVSTFLLFCACISAFFLLYFVFEQNFIIDIKIYDWLAFESFTSTISININTITAIMLVVVTVVSSLVHLYSIAYMHEDPHTQRFFAYLSLFTFFMIILVTAKDFMQLFLGWEGVGVCSYLLIGFWFKKESANSAAIKAFITNRVADVFMASGVCLAYYTFKTLNFEHIFSQVNSGITTAFFASKTITVAGTKFDAITLIGTLLFLGAMGKSAQLFLHVWLPDAMEGPTPVSALIHAATMVTAGVFLMSKCWIFVENSVFLQIMITLVGATTAIFAATVALVQTDIKKIIAYSTCSQLGYMFFAIGVLVPSAAIFHLATHAFFKALLFLGAGSVIHACHHEQNIFKMGGLAKKIPFTFSIMMIGSLAIAGLWPFAGYFSKDAILEAAYASHSAHGNYAFVLGIVAAFLTSFYSWRLICLVFHGKNNGDGHHHPHESPLTMLIPLGILALLAIISGFIGNKFHILESGFWKGAIFVSHEKIEAMHHVSAFIKYLPTILSIIAIFLAYFLYLKKVNILEKLAQTFTPLRKILEKKYYFDEIYTFIFVRPLMFLSTVTIIFCEKILDAIIPHSFVSIAKFGGKISGKVQSGIIGAYFLIIFVFIVLIFQYYMFINESGLMYNVILWVKNLFN